MNKDEMFDGMKARVDELANHGPEAFRVAALLGLGVLSGMGILWLILKVL
jgi:hypothetical protein